MTPATVGRSRPLQQLPEVIFGHSDNRQDVSKRSPGHIPASMDRYRNGAAIRVLHDVVAATNPRDGEPGSFQGPDDSSAGQGRHLTHDNNLLPRNSRQRNCRRGHASRLARILAKQAPVKAAVAAICPARYRDQAVIYGTRSQPAMSGDFERELFRRADLGDQRHQRLAQIGYRLLRREAVTNRASTGPDQRGGAPHAILILLKGIGHMHGSAHAVSLDQPARTGPLTGSDPTPSAVAGSHDANIALRTMQVTEMVDRTDHDTNRLVLIEGAPLPVRLARSRRVKAAKCPGPATRVASSHDLMTALVTCGSAARPPPLLPGWPGSPARFPTVTCGCSPAGTAPPDGTPMPSRCRSLSSASKIDRSLTWAVTLRMVSLT
jgi:hypothetical protein